MIIRILPPERGATIRDEVGEIKVGGGAEILVGVMECWSIGMMGLNHNSTTPILQFSTRKRSN
jgi:hypothetical protein